MYRLGNHKTWQPSTILGIWLDQKSQPLDQLANRKYWLWQMPTEIFNYKTNAHSITPWARAAANISAEIAVAKEMVKEKKTWKEIIRLHYHQYETGFTKDPFDTLLDKQSWDHAINLKDNMEPILDCKIYPLGPGEQDEWTQYIPWREPIFRKNQTITIKDYITILLYQEKGW
jgi:hypothetical protein